jgi:hypothetical protein
MMVDVEAILFPSKHAMITNSANSKENLPDSDTTNAQDSIHRFYYMIRWTSLCFDTCSYFLQLTIGDQLDLVVKGRSA